jgi:hypothetical protein
MAKRGEVLLWLQRFRQLVLPEASVGESVRPTVVCVDVEVHATSIRIESEEEAWFVDRLVAVTGQEECR